MDIGSHRLDVLAFLFGAVEETRGMAVTFDSQERVEQAVSASLKCASGTLCTVSGDHVSGRLADSLHITGTAGSIVSDPLDGHSLSLATRERSEELSFAKDSAPHVGLVRHIEGVLLDGRPNQSSGRDGLVTEQVLDCVVRKDFTYEYGPAVSRNSVYPGRTVSTWPIRTLRPLPIAILSIRPRGSIRTQHNSPSRHSSHSV